jgi:predicted RNA-binding protein with RPS1 domain
MPTIAEQQLPAEKFSAMCEDLRAIAARPTLAQVREVLVRYGVTSPKARDGKPSAMAAKAVLDGPFARYVARLNAGRETREALCAAAGAGVHPLDAIEEAMVLELQDAIVGADGGEIDVKWIVDRLSQLRSSISMRENSRRQQADLERKQKETEAKLALAEQREALFREQIEKLQADREERERKKQELLARIESAKKKSGLTKETLAQIEQEAKLL